MKDLLKEVYGDLTQKETIPAYAPKKDNNDPEKYLEFLKKKGVELNKKVKEQIDKMVEGIKAYEGWKEGIIIPKQKEETPKEYTVEFVKPKRDPFMPLIPILPQEIPEE